MTLSHHDLSKNDTLKITARGIRSLMALDPEGFIPEVGARIDRAVRLPDGAGIAADAIQRLAKMTRIPDRTLVALVEAHLVVRIAGGRLFTCLNGKTSFDVFRQLSRILHADEDLRWMKERILKAAEESGRGVPNYELAGMVDKMLAGRRVIMFEFGKDRPHHEWLARLAWMIDGYAGACHRRVNWTSGSVEFSRSLLSL